MSFFFEFPHTRTYDSDLGWLIHAYQLLKAQADDIQGSIQQIVDETLNDPAYVARVLAVLAPLNVKYPPSDVGLDPAKGDGVTDDTDAITGMIAYAYEHNMPLLFPAGQYVVSGLTLSNDMTFIGLGGTLFLKAGAVNPLITVKGGYLTATGLEFNGNIAGQTDPENVFVVDGGGFKLDNCVITGGVDGIHADIDTTSFLTAVDIRNFTEYGVYVEGSSFVNVNGITMDVASGGAMRFMRIECNDCIVSDFSSNAVISIGFELTGNNNAITARIANAETPVSDGGVGNTWTIYGKDEKRYFNGNVSLEADNYSENVARDYTGTYGDVEHSATGHYNISGEDIRLNPANPLTYKEPQDLGNGFKYVQFKDPAGNPYNVLVATSEVISGLTRFVNVKDYGAIGDGSNDDTAAFQAAFNTGYNIYVPTDGGEQYRVSGASISTISQTIFTLPSLNSMGRIAGDGDIFIINTENVRIVGLTFEPLTGGTGSALKINGNTENGASDCIIRDCRFGQFDKAINNNGRGLEVENCRFVQSNYCVVNDYEYDGEGLQSAVNGNRAFRFENNRIHSLSYVVYNRSGILRGAKITGNVIDIGGTLLLSNSSIIESVIANNLVNLNTRSAIRLMNGEYFDNVIEGNVFEGRDEGGSYAIEVNSKVTSFKNSVISNNIFRNTERDAIVFATPIQHCIVASNSFNNIANATASNADACIEFAGMSECIITGNSFMQMTTISALRGNDTSANVSGTIVQNNTHSATDIISSYTDGSGNQIQTY